MKIKVKFCDFWKGFEDDNNFFWIFLSRKFSLELSDNPQVLFYGPFGNKHREFKCLKIFHTGENIRPNFNECDFAFSFDYSNDKRNYRFPLYAWYGEHDKILTNRSENFNIEKKKFCNFIYSNSKATERIDFFNQLSLYKIVDSGGKVLNNLGYKVSNKLDFISKYKFTICFENCSYPGYTSEKIYEAMLSNSIPIYWGNPLIHLDFNPKSFVNVHDFDSFEKAIERIIELDRDDDLYFEMLSQPYFHNNVVPKQLQLSTIYDHFEYIFSLIDTYNPVSNTLIYKINFFYKDLRNWLINKTRILK